MSPEGGEADAVAQSVVDLLSERGLDLAVAESLTAGACCDHLVRCPGAGEVVLGAVVAYDRRVKQRVLGVTPGPVVSRLAAAEMAAGVRSLMGADVGLATTGVAGPAEMDGQPVGTVWIATDVEGAGHQTHHRFSGDPDEVRARAVHRALLQLDEQTRGTLR